MLYLQATNQEKANIINSIHYAIIDGMIKTWKRCQTLNHNPEEADFIAGILLETVPQIYRSLSQLFRRYNIHFSLASVYCHQSPRVKYVGINKAYCEIGDILFVHFHRTRFQKYQRRALIYQAKLSQKQPYRIPASEEHQLRLYTDWPDFEYCYSGLLNGKKRRITPKSPHPGGQYMLIDKRPPTDPQSGLLGISGTYPVGSCIPNKFLNAHCDLATELFKFLIFQTGKMFNNQQRSANRGDWSEFIWDLIDVARLKAFNRRNSGLVSKSRYAGGALQLSQLDGFFYTETTADSVTTIASEILGRNKGLYTSHDNTIPPIINDEIRSDSNDHGISLVLMETSSGNIE